MLVPERSPTFAEKIDDMLQNKFNDLNTRDRVAMHVAIGEMTYCPNLNEAYGMYANGRRASSRYEKAMWLAMHVDFRKIKEYIGFELVWICSHCGKPIYWGYSGFSENGDNIWYCSDECLHEHYSEEAAESKYDEGTLEYVPNLWEIGSDKRKNWPDGKRMTKKDRIVKYIVMGEIINSDKLGEAFGYFDGPKTIRGRYRQAEWLLRHVAFENLDTCFDFECIRICSHCGKPMCWGFIINDGCDYYCSLDCLYKHYSAEEYLTLYNHGNGNAYYTSWID